VTFRRRPASPIRRLFLVLAAAVLSWGGAAGCGSSSAARPIDRHASVAVAPGGRVEVPIRPNRAGAPLVPVRGKTSAPWEMMLDTGAPSVVVSPEIAKREGWPVRHGEMYSVDAIGNRQDVGLADAKMIRIGGTAATFRDFDAMVMSPRSLKFGEGTGDGALGLMLFHNVLLTIDFPNNRLILEPGNLPPPDGRDVLPMKLDAAGHAFVPIRVGTREVWAMIDTGFSSGLAVPTAEARQFPGTSRSVTGDLVTTWHGTVRSKTARLTEPLRVGRQVFHRPVVDVGISNDVVLGIEYLQHFAITIDQRNGRARFTRRANGPIEFGPLRRPGFTVDPDTNLVTDVIPNSHASRAGLRVGERVLRIGVRTDAPPSKRPAPARTQLGFSAVTPGDADAAEGYAPNASTKGDGLPDVLVVEVIRNGRPTMLDVPMTTLLP
jgi:predicted aspartyl protease